MCVAPSNSAHRRPILTALSIPGSTDSGPSSRPPPPGCPVRNTEPEIFTFDIGPMKVTGPRRNPAGGRAKRPRRVLYPAKVRRYLPPPETDLALRWLYLLGVVLLLQICFEEPEGDTLLAGHQGPQ
ncbi:hypothetical protein GDO86_014738, partial [Hymenochirus boettgeri]